MIGGRNVAVQCDVTAYSLLAHADADELTRLIDSINPREVVLVHGDGAARTAWRIVSTQCQSAPQSASAAHGRHPAVWAPHTGAQPGKSTGTGRYRSGRRSGCRHLPRLVKHLLTRPSAPPWSPAAFLSGYGIGTGTTPTLRRSSPCWSANRLACAGIRNGRSCTR